MKTKLYAPGKPLENGCRGLFRKNIIYYREKRGLTQAAAAEEAGTAKITWIKYERGDRFPTAELLDSVAEAVDVSVQSLFRPRPKSAVVSRKQTA